MKRLVLVGGGHAHVHVLQALARAPLAGAEVLLVTPFARQMYSGMVPGLVAGHYSTAACAIPLPPLATAARAVLLEASASHIDTAARRVLLSDGRSVEYELLSLDTGATMDRNRLPGAREHGLFVRPIEDFVRLLETRLETRLDSLLGLAPSRLLEVVVIGAGAAGVELAMALQYRLGAHGKERARVALVTGGPPPLEGFAAPVMARVRRALAARRITVFHEPAAAIEAGAVVLASGARLACDVPLIATGAEAPAWLAASGLALDERGFVATGATLQSRSHAEVFAVGDVASRSDLPHPKSGVYAVRGGPPLVLNLRRFVAGEPLLPYRPQTRTLNLISCGERSAVATWGGWSAQGRWVWWWKDRIDRAFVARYAGPQAGLAGVIPAAGTK